MAASSAVSCSNLLAPVCAVGVDKEGMCIQPSSSLHCSLAAGTEKEKKLSKESLLLPTSLLVQCLGVLCVLLLPPHSLLATLTPHRAGAGAAVAFEDPTDSKQVLHALWNWEPGRAGSGAQSQPVQVRPPEPNAAPVLECDPCWPIQARLLPEQLSSWARCLGRAIPLRGAFQPSQAFSGEADRLPSCPALCCSSCSELGSPRGDSRSPAVLQGRGTDNGGIHSCPASIPSFMGQRLRV